MLYLAVKAISGVIVAVASEVAKRSPAFGALIVSLPLVTILSILWLWKDAGDQERIASHMLTTHRYVLPTLPMFVLVPMMQRAGSALVFAWSGVGDDPAVFLTVRVRVRALAQFGSITHNPAERVLLWSMQETEGARAPPQTCARNQSPVCALMLPYGGGAPHRQNAIRSSLAPAVGLPLRDRARAVGRSPAIRNGGQAGALANTE